MFSELKVTIKDEDKKLDKKFILYDPYQVNPNDETIKKCIDETLENFSGQPTDVKVNITLEIQ